MWPVIFNDFGMLYVKFTMDYSAYDYVIRGKIVREVYMHLKSRNWFADYWFKKKENIKIFFTIAKYILLLHKVLTKNGCHINRSYDIKLQSNFEDISRI